MKALLAIALIACTVFAVALLLSVSSTNVKPRPGPAGRDTVRNRDKLAAPERPGKHTATPDEHKEVPPKPAATGIVDTGPYDPKSFDKVGYWTLGGGKPYSPKENVLLVYEFCKRNNLLKHEKKDFIAAFRAAHRYDNEQKGVNKPDFGIDDFGGILRYHTLEFSVGDGWVWQMNRTDDYYVEPAVPLSSPHKTLFDDFGDGFIRYTRNRSSIEREEEIQQLERAAGLTYEEGRRIAESFAKRNCKDMRDPKRRFFLAEAVSCAPAREPDIYADEFNGGTIKYCYCWREKPLEGELYRWCNVVEVDVNPKTRDIVKFATLHNPRYDIAVREPPAIDSDSAFRAAERLLAHDAEAIKKTIREMCEMVDDVSPRRPELILYAADRKTGKMFWNVSFVYLTRFHDSESYDSVTIDIRVDAVTGETCYNGVWRERRHKAIPVKVEPCRLSRIAEHSALGGVLGQLPSPTLPVLEPLVLPDD